MSQTTLETLLGVTAPLSRHMLSQELECLVCPRHGLRVDVWSQLQGGWVLLTPIIPRDKGGVLGAIRVLRRYQTTCRSLRQNSPRVRRYQLRGVRLIAACPGGSVAWVVEAYGESVAMGSVNEDVKAKLLWRNGRPERVTKHYSAGTSKKRRANAENKRKRKP